MKSPEKGAERRKKEIGQKDQKGTTVKEGKGIIGVIEIIETLNAETRIEGITRETFVGEMIGHKKRTPISS